MRLKRQFWNNDRDKQLRSLVEQGVKFRAIAEIMGHSRDACLGRWHRLKQGRKPGGRLYQWTDEDDAELIRMIRDGHTKRAVAKHFGIGPNTLLRRYRLLGLDCTRPDDADFYDDDEEQEVEHQRTAHDALLRALQRAYGEQGYPS